MYDDYSTFLIDENLEETHLFSLRFCPVKCISNITEKENRMKKKDFLQILLAFIHIPAMPLIAQNMSEDKGIISFPESSYMDEIRKNSMSQESSLIPAVSISNTFEMTSLSSPSMLFKNNPVLWNYDLSDTDKLSKRLSVTSFRQQAIYSGLGDYTNIGATFRWSPSKSKFSIDAGGFAGTQHGYMVFSQQTIWGTNMGLNYEISPKFQLSLKGQYVNSSNIDPFLYQNRFFLNTNVGLFAEYKPTKNLSLGFGLLYLYESMKRNWSPQGGVRVTFYF